MTVVDVKHPDKKANTPKHVARLGFVRRVLEARGWPLESWTGEDEIVVDNVSAFASARRPAVVDLDLIPPILAAASDTTTLGELERSMAGTAPR